MRSAASVPATVAEPENEEVLIALGKVPELQHLSAATRWRLAVSGAIEAVRIGRRIYTSRRAVKQFLDAATIRPASEGGMQ